MLLEVVHLSTGFPIRASGWPYRDSGLRCSAWLVPLSPFAENEMRAVVVVHVRTAMVP
jgi:hypothetical protein